MILIITHKQDYTADFLINLLNRAKIGYLRLNCEDILISPTYTISDKTHYNAHFLNYPAIKSIWFRRTEIPDIKTKNLSQKLYFIREFDALIDNISCSLNDCKWLGEPFSVRKAENKVLQLKTASKAGFKTPKTLITNTKSELKQFYLDNAQTIIKPLYSGLVPDGDENAVIFTSLLTTEHIEKLDEFDLTPCIYQEYIEKEYELRVTVVGRDIFAAKVDSQLEDDTKTDWRKGKPRFTIYDLPQPIKEKCLKICDYLGLNFGAIDLIKTTEGEYVFLEINPNGQWAWIEMETGIQISKAIINYLLT